MHQKCPAKNPAAVHPRTWPRYRSSWVRWVRVAAGLLVALTSGASTTSATETETGSRWKLFVDAPGMYALEFEALADLMGVPIEPQRIRLSHRGESVPYWIDVDAVRLGQGDRILFLATRRQMWPRSLTSEASLAVIVLDLDGPVVEDLPMAARPRPASTVDNGRPLPTTAAVRRFHFEEDLLRAPLTDGAARNGVDTLWFWGTATERGSAVHTMNLQGLNELPPESGSIEIRAHLLGGSDPKVPEGVFQHRVDLLLNGKPIGTSHWSGRRLHEAVVVTSASHFQSSNPQLTVSVPRRVLEGARDPIIDLVYVDRVEVRFGITAITAAVDAPLDIGASDAATWLPDQTLDLQTSAEAYLLGEEGWAAAAQPDGWIVPPTAATEAWRVDGPLQKPLAVLPMATADPMPTREVDYVMIAPPGLVAGAERLAAAHRRRGLEVAVVDAHAVYDLYGLGARSAEAIQAFLVAVSERSAKLRFVLLVGDADWMVSRSNVPYPQAEAAARNLVPTWTELTEFGPAASDHAYVASAVDDTRPRLAIGRLPFRDPKVLDQVVDKIEAYLAMDSVEAPSVLLASDRSRVSVSRSRRVARALEEGALRVVEVGTEDDRPLDVQLIEALDRSPAVLHFSGHGSRHAWQLGATYALGETAFFDREDVFRLQPVSRPPIVLSISCATAPFDHPNADSLAEIMLQADGRGAIAFVGASARLFTPPHFGATMLQALEQGETVGEAMATAKETLGSRRISVLYSLLGDPALPLR